MSTPADARKLRPWYLVAAMGLMWVMGVFGATGGCSELSYLRGSQEMPDEITRGVDEAEHPIMRIEMVRQQARLLALAQMHARAFPLAAARMLLCLLLVLVAGAAIAGRRHARTLALQAIAGNAILVVIAYLLHGPVRDAIASAVAEDAVENVSGPLPGMNREQTVELFRSQQLESERLRVGLELSVFAMAALALARPRSKAYFAAMEAANVDASES